MGVGDVIGKYKMSSKFNHSRYENRAGTLALIFMAVFLLCYPISSFGIVHCIAIISIGFVNGLLLWQAWKKGNSLAQGLHIIFPVLVSTYYLNGNGGSSFEVISAVSLLFSAEFSTVFSLRYKNNSNRESAA